MGKQALLNHMQRESTIGETTSWRGGNQAEGVTRPSEASEARISATIALEQRVPTVKIS